MQKLIITVLVSFALSMIAGPFIIPWLKRLKVGQTINQFGPRSHQGKQGTATMGGLVFIFASTVTALIMGVWKDAGGYFLLFEILTMLAFAFIGFADDYVKVVKRRSVGLTPVQKMVPQALIALVLSLLAYLNPYIGSELVIPFTERTINLGIFYIPFMVVIIVGVVNSANLLDGLDGLCAGSGMIDFGTLALISMSLAATESGMNPDLYNTALFSGAMCGAILGFLRFNTHPAVTFMGDVGSFAIGGALIAVAIVTRLTLILPIIAFTMMISSFSDIIQVIYCRFSGGKRIFRMAPIHHHFELSGIPETKIVTMYDVLTALLCFVALLGYVK